MENRIIEIARKKTQKQTGKREQQSWKNREASPAFFGRSEGSQPPKFPPDIKPERRSVSISSNSALIISLPLRAVASTPVALKTVKSRTRSKAKTAQKSTPPKPRVAKPDVKAKTVRKPATRKPRVRKSPEKPAVLDVLNVAIPPAVEVVAEQPTAPLPRARSVAVYRKNGMLDILGYWMRTRVSDIFKLLKPRPKMGKQVPKIGDLIAENTALRQEIARLRALQ